jgi:hypothetical protein
VVRTTHMAPACFRIEGVISGQSVQPPRTRRSSRARPAISTRPPRPGEPGLVSDHDPPTPPCASPISTVVEVPRIVGLVNEHSRPSTRSAVTPIQSSTSVTPTGSVPRAAPAESSIDGGRALPYPVAKNPQPDSDPFLAAVGSLRDLVRHLVSTSTWSFAFACAGGAASRLVLLLVPLLKEDTIVSGLLFLCGISVGALIGRPLDRRCRRTRARPRRRRRRRTMLALIAVVLALLVTADVLLRWFR